MHLTNYLLSKVAVVINIGGKLELKHSKISANTRLFYDHINHRENKEKIISHGGAEIHMFSQRKAENISEEIMHTYIDEIQPDFLHQRIFCNQSKRQ